MENTLQVVEKPIPLPARPAYGHKGMFGRVLVIGGQDEMIGAPVLAAMAALRAGAGLVQIAVPRSILHTALSICPELIGLGLGEDARRLIEAAAEADAVVIGPGLGQSNDARNRLKAIAGLGKPLVVDADALNILSGLKQWPTKTFRSQAVLTPHPAEMRRLANLLPTNQAGAWKWGGKIPADHESRADVAAVAAREFGQLIVLKGHRTIVSNGQKLYVNTTGDSTLSKAGSGDILCGLLACFLAQHIESFDAACLAVYLHGLAGELAGKTFGQRGALARDIIDHLPTAILQHEAAK